jgi:hypothetical protein
MDGAHALTIAHGSYRSRLSPECFGGDQRLVRGARQPRSAESPSDRRRAASDLATMSGTSIRRAVGLALLLVALAAAFTVSYDSAFALCTHTTGYDAATTCAPPGVDLIALFFLPGLAFFVPDLRE